jgi:hypothetical protein
MSTVISRWTFLPVTAGDWKTCSDIVSGVVASLLEYEYEDAEGVKRRVATDPPGLYSLAALTGYCSRMPNLAKCQSAGVARGLETKNSGDCGCRASLVRRTNTQDAWATTRNNN